MSIMKQMKDKTAQMQCQNVLHTFVKYLRVTSGKELEKFDYYFDVFHLKCAPVTNEVGVFLSNKNGSGFTLKGLSQDV
ncbi:MAG: hypothetical protein Q8898_11045 [Bacillota bacterium]|nr:hypothetical protein [Bacillota bacterium]